VWRAIPRGEIWQKSLDGETFETGDYWTQLHAKLEKRGYYEQVARENAELAERVRTLPPRKYPIPVPRFEWQEDVTGRKRLVQAGFWNDA
jgi:hypothetical protein